MNFSIKAKFQGIRSFYIIKILSSFCAQLVTLFLVYLLPPPEYGHLALIISVAQLMFILTSGWSNGTIINLGSKSYAETGTYSSIVLYRFIIVTASFLIISLLFLILKIPISNFIFKSENYGLVYILFLGYVFYDFSSQMLYPGNKDLVQSFSELIATLSLLTLTFICVKSIQTYIYIYSGVFFVFFSTIGILFLIYYGSHKVIWNNKEFCFVLKYSFWQILSVIGIYITNIGINYILAFYKISVDEIGLYNFAYRLFSGFSPFFALFGIIIPKWIYNIEKKKLHRILIRRILYSTCFLATLYICVAMILKPFIRLVDKPDYLQSAEYFILLFPAFLFMCFGNLMNTVIMNTNHFKQAQFAIVFQCISLLTFSLLLVHFQGIKGALGATTISFMTGALCLYFLYKKKIRQDIVSQ